MFVFLLFYYFCFFIINYINKNKIKNKTKGIKNINKIKSKILSPNNNNNNNINKLRGATMCYNNNNTLLIFGGFIDGYTFEPTNELWEFDIEKNTICQTKTTNPPKPRGAHTAHIKNNKLFIIGGYYWDKGDKDADESGIIHVLELSSNVWNKINILYNNFITRYTNIFIFTPV